MQRGDRFGPRLFSPRGVDGAERQSAIHLAKHLFHHGAALVHLGHHAVGLPRVIECDNSFGPLGRPQSMHRAIIEHVAAAVGAKPGADNATGIAMRAKSGGRINRHNDAPQLWSK